MGFAWRWHWNGNGNGNGNGDRGLRIEDRGIPDEMVDSLGEVRTNVIGWGQIKL